VVRLEQSVVNLWNDTLPTACICLIRPLVMFKAAASPGSIHAVAQNLFKIKADNLIVHSTLGNCTEYVNLTQSEKDYLVHVFRHRNLHTNLIVVLF